MEFELVRSRRKTLGLTVLPDGTVQVKAPLTLSNQIIRRWVESKAGWIATRQQELARRAQVQAAYTLSEGQTLPLLGRRLPIRLEPGCSAARLDGETAVLPLGENNPEPVALRRQAAQNLYRQLARPYFTQLLDRWSPRMGLCPTGLHITSARTRWGSCSGKNSLSFSWRLLLCPPECVEYVVVHELAHIAHHDHSPRFWQTVQRQLPDYRQRQEALRRFGHALAEEGWMSDLCTPAGDPGPGEDDGRG